MSDEEKKEPKHPEKLLKEKAQEIFNALLEDLPQHPDVAAILEKHKARMANGEKVVHPIQEENGIPAPTPPTQPSAKVEKIIPPSPPQDVLNDLFQINVADLPLEAMPLLAHDFVDQMHRFKLIEIVDALKAIPGKSRRKQQKIYILKKKLVRAICKKRGADHQTMLDLLKQIPRKSASFKAKQTPRAPSKKPSQKTENNQCL